MHRVIVVVFLIIFTGLPVFSQMLTGEVKYSVSGAREEISAQKPVKFDREVIKANIVDYNRAENVGYLLKGVTELKDRTLAYFSDGSYGLVYKDNPLEVYYYGADGILTHNEKRDSVEYPYRSYKYTASGRLVNMSLRTSEDETFIFEPGGELIAHWLGTRCYDENNNVIMSRRVLK